MFCDHLAQCRLIGKANKQVPLTSIPFLENMYDLVMSTALL